MMNTQARASTKYSLSNSDEVTECDLCEQFKFGGVYDFKKICCRVRLILNLKLKTNRTGWIALWRRKDGHEVADRIERLVNQRWKDRKKCVEK